MFCKYSMHNNPKLAEQLMFGSTDDKIIDINKELWKKFDGNRSDYYLYIAKLCGRPITARARYVLAMAYSWNSVIYCQEAIKYLELYLSKPLYKEKCVSNGIYSNEEMRKKHLCEMHRYLGLAYMNNYELEEALKNYYIALNYCPNITWPYLKIAETYYCKKDFYNTIRILEKAKRMKSAIYPTEHTDYSKDFISIPAIEKCLNEYKQRIYIETTYPYKQKQVRELVILELEKNNIHINLTQPKLKLICEQFNLKNNKEYFYKYPDSNIYRCSKKLIDILTNSLVNNPNLIEEIKKIKK